MLISPFCTDVDTVPVLVNTAVHGHDVLVPYCACTCFQIRLAVLVHAVPVHTAVDGLAVLVHAGPPGIVPEAAPVGRLLVANNLGHILQPDKKIYRCVTSL